MVGLVGEGLDCEAAVTRDLLHLGLPKTEKKKKEKNKRGGSRAALERRWHLRAGTSGRCWYCSQVVPVLNAGWEMWVPQARIPVGGPLIGRSRAIGPAFRGYLCTCTVVPCLDRREGTVQLGIRGARWVPPAATIAEVWFGRGELLGMRLWDEPCESSSSPAERKGSGRCDHSVGITNVNRRLDETCHDSHISSRLACSPPRSCWALGDTRSPTRA